MSKSTKPIRTARAATIKNWSKNASKSFAFSTLNVLKEVSPNIASTATSAADAARDMRSFVSQTKYQISTQGIESTKLGRSAKDIFDSAMNDIRTGNFSLKKSSDDAFDTYDDIFGGIDTGTNSNDSPEEIREAGLGRAITASSSASIDGMRNMTNVIASTQLKSAKMMSDKSANIAMLGINKINATLLGMNSRLDAINSNLVSMIEFQNQNVSVTNQAMLQYFDRSLDMMNGLSKSMTMGRKDRKYNDADFLYDGLDVNGYGKQIKKNFGNTMIGSLLSMGKMMHDMDKSMGPSRNAPQLAIEKLIIPALMGSRLTTNISGFDTNINKYMKAGLYRLGDMGNDYSKMGSKGNILRFIGQVLGMERPSNKNIRMGDFHKDSMMWNGEAQRTLVEVIPTYLSRMEASLAIMSGASENKLGSKQLLYDMESGTFKNKSKLTKEFYEEQNNEIISAVNDMMQKTKDFMKLNDITTDKQTEIQKQLTKIFSERLNNNSGYTEKYQKDMANVNQYFTRDQAKSITQMMEDSQEKARENKTDFNHRIQSETSGAKYRALFNMNGSGPDQKMKFSNMFQYGYGFGGFGSSEDEILGYVSEFSQNAPEGFNFKINNQLISEYNRQKSRNDEDDSALKRIVKQEYNRQFNLFKTKGWKAKFSTAGNWHANLDQAMDHGISYMDDTAFRAAYGNTVIKNNAASSRGTATASAVGTAGGKFKSKVNTSNHQLDQNARRIPKNEKEMENMTSRDVESGLYGNKAAMLATEKNIPESAADNYQSAGIGELGAVQAQNARSQSSLMDSLKQTVVSLHSGSMAVLSSLFGKSGFFRNMMESDWMKDNMTKLRSYLFDEKSGIFKEVTNSFLDAADYMKYVFNGKAYTDRKGLTHEDTDNAVFKYLGKGYKTAFGFTMQHLFGDDYENNEIYQKYFSWLGGKEARSKAKSARAQREQNPTQKASSSTYKNRKLLGAGNSNTDYLALPEHARGNTSEALVVVPTTDSKGNKTERTYNINDSEGIHAAAEQNIVNATASAVGNINEGSKALSTIMLGKNKTADEAEKSFFEKFKDNLPKMLTAGIVGAGITLLSGGTMGPLFGAFLPNGPVGGAIVGMGLQIASTSEKFKKFLLGEKDENNERTGGLISRKMQAGFKKALPTIVGGSVIGAITRGGIVNHIPGVGMLTSTLLPGGILSGAILGLGTSLLMNSESFKDILFGKEDAEGKRTEGLSHIFNGSKEVLSAISPYVKPALKGTAIGLGTGLVLSKMGYIGSALSLGGPVGMGLLGLGVGIASQTERFKKFLFGDEELDKNGNPTGNRLKNGLFSKIQVMLQMNVFDPIADSMKHNAKQFAYWIKGKIIIPFLQIFQPIKNQLQDIGGYIKEKVDKLSDGIQHIIGGFFKKLFSPIAKIVGKVVSGIATGVRTAMQVALSPIAGTLGLIKFALAPGREARDMQFKGRYLKGQYGDNNRGFLQRLGDVMNIGRDKNGSDGGYFGAHADYANEQKELGKRTNDWSLRQESSRNRTARNAENKEYGQSKALNKLRQKKGQQWGYNESVILSDREIKAMQKELGRGRYGNLNQNGLQTEDQIKQLIFHKGEWMGKYGPEAKIKEQKTQRETESYQNNVDSKLTTIANLISQAFFHTNAFKQPSKAAAAGFTGFVTNSAKPSPKEAQFNLSDMNFDDIQTQGHGIQNSKTLKAGYKAYAKRGMGVNDYLRTMLGDDYEDRIKDAGFATSADSAIKKPIRGADEKQEAATSSEAQSNRLFAAMAQIMSNGRLKVKHIKNILSGKKLTDADAQSYGSSSEEIGANTTKGFAAILNQRDAIAEKNQTKSAKLEQEEMESEESESLGSTIASDKQLSIVSNASLATTGKKPIKKQKTLFGRILSGIGGVFGNIFGGISSLFSGNPKDIIMNLGMKSLIGASIVGFFKTMGSSILDSMKEDHPKIYSTIMNKIAPFFTDTIPTWWKEKASPFLKEKLPEFIENTITVWRDFMVTNAKLISTSIKTVFETLVPIVGDAITEAIGDAVDYITHGSKVTGETAKQQAVSEGKNLVNSGKVDDNGDSIYYVSRKGQTASGIGSATGKFGLATINTSAKLVAKEAVTKGTIKEAVAFSRKDNILVKVLKLAESGMTKLMQNEKVANILNKIPKFKSKWLTSFQSLIKSTLDRVASKNITVISKLSSKVSTKLGSTTMGKVPWLQIAYYGYNVLEGALNPEKLFNVDSNVIDFKMHLISSLFSLLYSTTGGALLDLAFSICAELMPYDPKCWLATEVYKAISSDADDDLLDNAQVAFSEEVSKYNIENKTNLNSHQYSEKKNKTILQKVGNWFANLFGKGDNTDYSEYESGSNSNMSANITVSTPVSTTTTSTSKTTFDSNNISVSKANYGKGIGYGNALSQGDSRWSNYKLGTLPNGRPSTMAAGGCGPTALSTAASIVGYGQDVSPVGIAKFAQRNGYIEQGGSTSNLFTQGATKLGMSSNPINADSIETSIKHGKPVIISGRSANGYGEVQPSPYTRAGHIVTATGVDNRGNIIIDNPETGNREIYSKNQLSSGMTGAWSIGKDESRHNSTVSGYGMPYYGKIKRSDYDKQAAAIDNIYSARTSTVTRNIYGGGGGRSSTVSNTLTFTKMGDINVTKWGSLGKSGSTAQNPFGLSSKEMNMSIMIFRIQLMEGKSLSSHIAEVLKSIVKMSNGNLKKKITYREITQAYKNYLSGNKKYKNVSLTFAEYATALRAFGMIQFYPKSIVRRGYSERFGADFTLSDIFVDKYASGSKYASRNNPFGFSPSDLTKHITRATINKSYNKWSISTDGYKAVLKRITVKHPIDNSYILVKDLTSLYNSKKIKFADYALILQDAGLIKFHLKTASASISTTSTTDIADAQAALSGIGTSDTGGHTTVSGLIAQIGNLVSAVSYVGTRALDSFGSKDGYNRIYDDNGNLLDTDAKAEFDNIVINGDNDSADDDDDTELTFSHNYNNKAGSGETRTEKPTLQNAAAAFVNKHLRTIMGAYDQYSVMPSMMLGQAGQESSWGTSSMAIANNNCFGLSSTPGWINNGGETSSDGKRRKYASKAESILDYAKIINAYYPQIIGSATYKQALKSANFKKYTPDAGYRQNVEKIIESNGFNYYDNRNNKSNIKSEYGINWGLGPAYYGPADNANAKITDLQSANYKILSHFNNKYNLGMNITDPSDPTSNTSENDNYIGAYTTSAGSAGQQKVVNKMGSILGKIKYSLGYPQNPDKNNASCASTVGWAYSKALDLPNMSASSTAQSKDTHFKTIYSNQGSAINTKTLQPGDVIYENWKRTMDNGSMQHTEMYAGGGKVLSHGGPGYGPVLKDYTGYRKAHTMKVRRYKGFIGNLDSMYGLGSYYGEGSNYRPQSINDVYTSKIPNYSQLIGGDISYGKSSPFGIVNNNSHRSHSYYGDSDESSNGETLAKDITEKLNVAVKTTDQGEKLNAIIGIMKDWYEYDKSKPASSNTSIIANNGNKNGSTATAKSTENSRLLTIHNKISSGKR